MVDGVLGRVRGPGRVRVPGLLRRRLRLTRSWTFSSSALFNASLLPRRRPPGVRRVRRRRPPGVLGVGVLGRPGTVMVSSISTNRHSQRQSRESNTWRAVHEAASAAQAHSHLSLRKVCLELQLLMAEFGQKHRQLLSSSSNPLQLSSALLGHSQRHKSLFSSSNPLHLSRALAGQSHWHVAELKSWKFLHLLAELGGHKHWQVARFSCRGGGHWMLKQGGGGGSPGSGGCGGSGGSGGGGPTMFWHWHWNMLKNWFTLQTGRTGHSQVHVRVLKKVLPGQFSCCMQTHLQLASSVCPGPQRMFTSQLGGGTGSGGGKALPGLQVQCCRLKI